MNLRPVILAGGSGKRLWPLSRNQYPKPFLVTNNQMSLVQNTVQRTLNLGLASPVIVCNEQNQYLLTNQLDSMAIRPEKILLEPVSKNTAPALTLAAIFLLNNSGDEVLFSMPSDHLIEEDKNFFQAVEIAHGLATKGGIVTLGIEIGKPDVNFGYIKKGQIQKNKYFELSEFYEKPDNATAQCMYESKDFLWNSGMFFMTASLWLEKLEMHAPDILTACETAVLNGSDDGIFFRPDQKSFELCQSKSIDLAVMENLRFPGTSAKNWVIPLDSKWSDLGSWSSFMGSQIPDSSNNLVKGNVFVDSVQDSVILSEHRTLAVSNVDNVIIVETSDAILVANKNQEHKIKELIEKLPTKSTSNFETHKKIFRPWGHFEILDSSEEFQVKKLTVLPGEALSLQAHKHRTEHWVVVSGVASVIKDDQKMTLKKDESTYIPAGTRHRLENNQKDKLEIIEVQSGSYLGEDDIVRFEDKYQRESRP